MSKKLIRAAGGVVHRNEDRPEFLVVRRPRYRDWTIPKGKLERGEGPKAAALREVEEETGFACIATATIGNVGYDVSGKRPKAVTYWLMEAVAGSFEPNSEVDKIKWLPGSEALEQVTYSRDRAVLQRAIEMAETSYLGRIYLVRHSPAGKRKKDDDKDVKRNLSSKGQRHARKLARRLRKHPVERVLTSPYRRCVSTVEPLAAALGLRIETDERLVEGRTLGDTLTLIRELAGISAVLCTHGDVVENVVKHILVEEIPVDGEAAWQKSSVWHLTTERGQIVSGTYTRPPS